MSEATGHRTSYVAIWAILTAALVVSLMLGMLSPSPLTIGVIFAIAAMKAWLVLAHFVHLKVEPRWVKVMVGCLVALLLVLFVGLVPDVAVRFAAVGSP